MKKVYAIEYSSCIYEAGFEVKSLHKTKYGAIKALEQLDNTLNNKNMEAARLVEYKLYE